MQNANAVDNKGCICSPSKVGGLAGKEACEWARRTPRRPHEVPPVGAEARREDHQSAALFFRWFLRILTSNLESRRPTSSLTRMKVSLSGPSALQHPWPTCQQFGPSAWHLYLHLHHVELEILFVYSEVQNVRRDGTSCITQCWKCWTTTQARQLLFQDVKEAWKSSQDGMLDSGDDC